MSPLSVLTLNLDKLLIYLQSIIGLLMFLALLPHQNVFTVYLKRIAVICNYVLMSFSQVCYFQHPSRPEPHHPLPRDDWSICQCVSPCRKLLQCIGIVRGGSLWRSVIKNLQMDLTLVI